MWSDSWHDVTAASSYFVHFYTISNNGAKKKPNRFDVYIYLKIERDVPYFMCIEMVFLLYFSLPYIHSLALPPTLPQMDGKWKVCKNKKSKKKKMKSGKNTPCEQIHMILRNTRYRARFSGWIFYRMVCRAFWINSLHMKWHPYYIEYFS